MNRDPKLFPKGPPVEKLPSNVRTSNLGSLIPVLSVVGVAWLQVLNDFLIDKEQSNNFFLTLVSNLLNSSSPPKSMDSRLFRVCRSIVSCSQQSVPHTDGAKERHLLHQLELQ